ncbi:hypothetical protein HDV00_008383, partial [Rhizophlyctis rosea]
MEKGDDAVAWGCTELVKERWKAHVFCKWLESTDPFALADLESKKRFYAACLQRIGDQHAGFGTQEERLGWKAIAKRMLANQ